MPQVSQDDETNTEKSDSTNNQNTSATTDASKNASKQDFSSKKNTDTRDESNPSDSKTSKNEKNNNAMESRRTIGTSNNPLASKHPRFDATHVNVVTSDSTTPSKKDHTLKEIRTSTITMRTAWFGQYYKLGMTACAKLFIQKILEVDQAARILPTNDNPDDIIVHENDFDGDNDNKWLRNSYYLHHEKSNSIHFTIRVKTIKSFKWMNQVISLFMRTTGNIVNMDTINANKLVTIGFFANFHRGLHNKQRLKDYCTLFLKEKFNLNIQMNIYPRNWYAGGGVNPDKAFLISVEVDTKIAQTVSNALMRCPFEGYTNIQYMPFTKYDDDYTERMRGVIAHHKVAQNSLEVLRVPKFNPLHPKTEFTTNEFSSIRDLLLSFNTPERQFVHDVDKGPGWSTSIIYNIDADDHMDTFLQELVPLLKQHLSSDSFSQVFQYDQPILDLLTTSRRVSSFEKKHVDKLFAQYNKKSSDNQLVAPIPRGKTNAWKSKSKPTFITPPKPSSDLNLPTPQPLPKSQSLSRNDIIAIIKETNTNPTTDLSNTTFNKEDIVAIINETVPRASSPPPNDPPLNKEDILAIINETVKVDTTKFIQTSDIDSIVSEKINTNVNPNNVSPDSVTSMINSATSQLRNEMKQEKAALEEKIDGVQTSLTLELKNVTNPFAQALLAVQQSNQQIVGMLNGSLPIHGNFPHLAQLNQLVPSSFPSKLGCLPNHGSHTPTHTTVSPAIPLPQIKVEADGEY